MNNPNAQSLLTHLADCWQTILDQALTNQRTALLSQLREGVKRLFAKADKETDEFKRSNNYVSLSEVLALIEKAGGE